jgi:uncharacterized membrane protein (UPF0127 family)
MKHNQEEHPWLYDEEPLYHENELLNNYTTHDINPLFDSPLRESPFRESPLRESPLRESPLRESPLKKSATSSRRIQLKEGETLHEYKTRRNRERRRARILKMTPEERSAFSKKESDRKKFKRESLKQGQPIKLPVKKTPKKHLMTPEEQKNQYIAGRIRYLKKQNRLNELNDEEKEFYERMQERIQSRRILPSRGGKRHTIKIIKRFTTTSDKKHGLMFVKKPLLENEGALFVYHNDHNQPEPEEDKKINKRGFWMKNTFIPLDVIALNKNKKVIGLIHHMKPHSLKRHCVPNETEYGIEINAGHNKRNKIKIGDEITFD